MHDHRRRSKQPTNAQAKRRRGAKERRSRTKTPFKRKDALMASALYAKNKHAQSQNTDCLSRRWGKEERLLHEENTNRSTLKRDIGTA